MKANCTTLGVIAGFLLLATPVRAQVTGLTINGQTSSISVTQGNNLSWQIMLPSGMTSQNELWIDVNQNGVVDAGTDKQIFVFSETDGQPGSDGPGDDDGSVNGVISTTLTGAGLAPAHWVFVAKNNGSGVAVAFTVNPLPSPAYTVSGTVSAPGGVNKSYIVFEASPANDSTGGGMRPFWHGVTDSSGNYTINFGGSLTTMNPWRVSHLSDQNLGRFIIAPNETTFTLTGHHTGVNFTMFQGTVFTGVVRDQLGSPIQNANPHTHDPFNPFSNSNEFRANTDVTGYYSFVVPPGKYFVHFVAEGYFDSWWNGKNSQNADTITVISQDSIKNINATLTKGAELKGRVMNWGQGVSAQVTISDQYSVQLFTTNTQGNGGWNATVTAGSYYVKFMRNGKTIYYNQKNGGPGDLIIVTGTNVADHIDANFMDGPPPPPPPPIIVSVRDVPNDQGKKVFVTWRAKEPDPIETSNGPPVGVQYYSVWEWWKGVWTFISEVPARRDTLYSVIAPTIFDSTISAGPFWSKFQVTSHFSYNFYVISSPVDSGYSLDNLAPNVPAGVAGSAAGSNLTIRWQKAQDEDFRYFSIYRSTTPNFSLTGLAPLARSTDTSFTDAGVIGATTYYYKITATDFSGNESAPSAQISTNLTGVDESAQLPTEYNLRQNYPNPFNPSTTISFDIPKESFVTLKVYNMLGQVILTLVEENKQQGRYSVMFDARNLSTGLYIYRLTAGDRSFIKKMSLVK